MKKVILTAFLLLFAITANSNAQLYKDSWKFGFGGTYPRLINTNVAPDVLNYGGFIGFQYDATETSGLRLKLKYNHFNSNLTTQSNSPEIKVDVVGANFDYLFHFAPCEVLHPYISVGVGGFVYFPDGSYSGPTPIEDESAFDFEIAFGFGGQYKFSDKWALTAEMTFHTPPLFGFDGNNVGNANSTIIGGGYDSYVEFGVGLLYEFSRGEESQYCELYSGISQSDIDYNKIEQIVQKYIPKEVVKEVVVEKPVKSENNNMNNQWVLVGVNFDFNSTKLTAESYPVLYHTVQILAQDPSMKVEIQGYTDNIGSESYNKKLSEDRANVVKNYLVAKGIDASRLQAVGYGESNPVADNKTADGRALNRRIEFKVLN